MVVSSTGLPPSTLPTAGTPLARDIWQEDDQRWAMAARWLLRSGFATVSDLADAIAAANPRIVDWTRLKAGSVVIVPLQPYQQG